MKKEKAKKELRSNPSVSSAERFGGGVTQGFSPDSSALKG